MAVISSLCCKLILARLKIAVLSKRFTCIAKLPLIIKEARKMIGHVAIYVPGASMKKIAKAVGLQVDTIVLDLEDSVAAGEKDSARELVARSVREMDFGNKFTMVRINSLDSSYWQADLRQAALLPVGAVLIPKASAKDIATVSDILDEAGANLAIVPLIESAVAVENIAQIITASPRIKGVFFGGEDYATDMGVKRTESGEEILYARMKIGNASRAFDIEAIDTPYTSITDLSGLECDLFRAKQLGFTGKSIIHPAHIDTVKRAFQASPEEIEFAKRLLKSIGTAGAGDVTAFSFEGKMVDEPII